MKIRKLLLGIAVSIGFASTALAQVPSNVPTNGLVAWYPFNGNANDESGNGYNGTVSGATLTQDRSGNINKAYNLSNINSKIELLSSNNYLGSSNYTISFWFNSEFNGNNQYVLSKRPSCLGGSEEFFEFRIDAGNNTIRYLRAGGLDLAVSFQPNVWNNYTLIRDSDSLYVFLNGVKSVASLGQYDLNPICVLGVSSSSACIANFGQTNKRYIGDIDDIGIWNRALNQLEITELYNSCNLTFSIQPANLSSYKGDATMFFAESNESSATYQWQVNTGVGFSDITDNCTYNGSISKTLNIASVSNAMHNYQYRCIATYNTCSDTSSEATLTVDTNNITVYDTTHVTINDTNIVTVTDTNYVTIQDTNYVTVTDTNYISINDTNYVTIQDTNYVTVNDTNLITVSDTNYVTIQDTNYVTVSDTNLITVLDTNYVTIQDTNYVTVNDTNIVTVTDTNYVTINDTNYISVTDTLKIDAVLSGVPAPNNTNSIKLYPNPAKDHLIINYGNYVSMNGYTLKITNTIGQIVYTTGITQQQDNIDLNSWSGNGVYFVHIIDDQSNTIEIRKIVLQ